MKTRTSHPSLRREQLRALRGTPSQCDPFALMAHEPLGYLDVEQKLTDEQWRYIGRFNGVPA